MTNHLLLYRTTVTYDREECPAPLVHRYEHLLTLEEANELQDEIEDDRYESIEDVLKDIDNGTYHWEFDTEDLKSIETGDECVFHLSESLSGVLLDDNQLNRLQEIDTTVKDLEDTISTLNVERRDLLSE
jgi:hypothetical protein